MEYSAIEQLLFGKRGHIDFVKPSREGKALSEETEKYFSEIEEKLKDFPELLKAYEDALDKFILQETTDFFKEGFRFGALLGMDITYEEK